MAEPTKTTMSPAEQQLFKSVAEGDADKLPRPSAEEIRAAIERGRQAREKVQNAVHPGTASSSRVFYK